MNNERVVTRGRFIAIEGIDGCGKTTQARLLADNLGALVTWEPGATPLGRALRQLVLSPGSEAGPTDRAEVFLLAADRAQHVSEIIQPTLETGRWVVTDRYSGSTLAYQGWGRGLNVSELRGLTEWATGGLEADFSILIDVPVEVARARLSAIPDRLEGLDVTFHERVRQGFLHLAEQDPKGWAIVDGSPPPAEVATVVAQMVEMRCGRP